MWCCRRKNPKAPKAFTLIELLLATALTAAVLAAVLGVVARAGRGLRSARKADEGRATEDALLELITTDLLNARRAEPAERGFRLFGLGRLGADTKEVRHGPVTVEYEVRRAGGQPWLLRRQFRSDARRGAVQSAELVCRGVERIELGGLQQPTSAPTSRPAARGAPLPQAVKVTVTFVQGGQDERPRTIERTVFLQ